MQPMLDKPRAMLIGRQGFFGSSAGRRTAEALKAKGYHNRFVFSLGTSHCDHRVFEQSLADTLVWLWHGYHTE